MQGIRGILLATLLAVAALSAVVYIAAGSVPIPRPGLGPRQGPSLASARSWGYQLQRFKPSMVAADIDVLVIDYSRDGSDRMALSRKALDELRERPGRPRRIILCYLSIGEAESYRYYWRTRWRSSPPEWLSNENEEWKGNYAVRYWQPGWKRLIVGSRPTLSDRVTELLDRRAKPYLDRVLEAGFDGVYLDRIDAYSNWEDQHGAARGEMIRLVQEIAGYARHRRPGFLIVAQNGEELLKSDAYRRTIDGVAKEDLLYGIEGDGSENAKEDVEASMRLLSRAREDGLLVLVVEYISEPGQRARAFSELTSRGFLPLFAHRGLSLPPEPIVAGDVAKSGAATATSQ